jgi:hypothetical protein
MRNLSVRAQEEERMDDPALPPETYAAVMRDLAKVNRLTMARRPTLAFLGRALAGRTAFRLLDVGFGDGDMLRGAASQPNWSASTSIRAAPLPRRRIHLPISQSTGGQAIMRNWPVPTSTW